jgi:hypothetical protein
MKTRSINFYQESIDNERHLYVRRVYQDARVEVQFLRHLLSNWLFVNSDLSFVHLIIFVFISNDDERFIR